MPIASADELPPETAVASSVMLAQMAPLATTLAPLLRIASGASPCGGHRSGASPRARENWYSTNEHVYVCQPLRKSAASNPPAGCGGSVPSSTSFHVGNGSPCEPSASYAACASASAPTVVRVCNWWRICAAAVGNFEEMTASVSKQDARNAPCLDLAAERKPSPPSRAGNVATSRASVSPCNAPAAIICANASQIAASWSTTHPSLARVVPCAPCGSLLGPPTWTASPMHIVGRASCKSD